MTTVESIERVLVRDLKTLRKEIMAFQDDQSLWSLPTGLRNSAGTLTLHLSGNLRHFIGAVLGHSKFLRDRDSEFANRKVSRAALLEGVDKAILEVRSALTSMTDEDLSKEYPVAVAGNVLPTGLLLIHLAAHFAYHLGQLDYLRRLLTGSSDAVGAQLLSELKD